MNRIGRSKKFKLYAVELSNGSTYHGSKKECVKRSPHKLYPVKVYAVQYCECNHSEYTAAQYVIHGACGVCGGKYEHGQAIIEFIFFMLVLVFIFFVVLPGIMTWANLPTLSDLFYLFVR